MHMLTDRIYAPELHAGLANSYPTTGRVTNQQVEYLAKSIVPKVTGTLSVADVKMVAHNLQ